MSERPLVVVAVQPDGTEERVQLGTAWQQGARWAVWLDPQLVHRRSTTGALHQLDPKVADLEYLAARARRTLEDPKKAKWHEEARAQLLQIEAEIDRVQSRPA